MKQKKFNKKLNLNKKTIVNLNNGEKGNVIGGDLEPGATNETCLTDCVCGMTPNHRTACPPSCTPTCASGCSLGGACC